MITIRLLTRDFTTDCSPSNRGNKEWLKKQDKVNGTINIAAPYPKNDYFRQTFIVPLLDENGFIEDKYYGIPLVNCDGINYTIQKWHPNMPKSLMNFSNKNK